MAEPVFALAVVLLHTSCVHLQPHLQQPEGQQSGLGGCPTYSKKGKRLTGSYPSLLWELTVPPFLATLSQPAHDIHLRDML